MSYIDELREKISKNDFYCKDMTKMCEDLIIQIKYAEIYNDYKDIYCFYKNETFYPDRYFRQYEEVEPEPEREERYQPPKKRCRSDDFDMEL